MFIMFSKHRNATGGHFIFFFPLSFLHGEGKEQNILFPTVCINTFSPLRHSALQMCMTDKNDHSSGNQDREDIQAVIQKLYRIPAGPLCHAGSHFALLITIFYHQSDKVSFSDKDVFLFWGKRGGIILGGTFSSSFLSLSIFFYSSSRLPWDTA